MPEPLSLLGALPLESGRRWGEAATEVQWDDARAVLGSDGPRRHWLGRSRGYSKTTDAAALTIVALLTLLAPGAYGYAAAADRDQARLLLAAIAGFARRAPALREVLDVQAWRVVSRRSGAVVEVLPADAASSWGLLPSWLVIDELCQWPTTGNARAFLDSLLSALPKVPDSRALVISTAGDPAHWSRRLYDIAGSDPLWHRSEVHGPAPWLRPEEIEAERRRLLPSMFGRMFMNEWLAAEDRLAGAEELAAAFVLDGPLEPRPGVRYLCGVDIGVKHDRTVVSVCHGERVDGARDRVRVVCDRQLVFAGSRDIPVQLETVEEALLEIHKRYRPARYVLDPWQAIGLAQRLRVKGLRIEEFTFSGASVGRLALTLFGLLRDRLLALPDDDGLRDELGNVRLRETSPGVLRIDHDSGRHDDRVISLALAAHAIASQPRGHGSIRSSAGDGRIARGPAADEGQLTAIPRGAALDRRRLRVDSPSGVAVPHPSGRTVREELARARRSSGYVGPEGPQ
ncbi:MAG TPA: terminase large subunit [Mycobacteriales bacterium]|nr:terminase large subunit [Mycobacteriales bacterium]